MVFFSVADSKRCRRLGVDITKFRDRHPVRWVRAVEQLDGMVRRPQGMGEKAKIDERGLHAVAFFVDRSANRVADHGDFEAVFEQVAEMGLDAEVAGRAGHDHLFDAPRAQLQEHVVRR